MGVPVVEQIKCQHRELGVGANNRRKARREKNSVDLLRDSVQINRDVTSGSDHSRSHC